MLYFLTSNPDKIKEAQDILQIPLQIKQLELEEIQSLDIEEIAKHKVEQAYQLLKKPVFIDDVGIYIESWNGFPGPFVKFLLKAGGNALILKMLKGEKNRKVIARCIIAYHDTKTIHLFMGETHGSIPLEEKGDRKIGWEPVFQPDGFEETYSQMSKEQKNQISHRKKALEKFKAFLKTQSVTS